MRREAGRVGEERSEAGKGRGGGELAKGGEGDFQNSSTSSKSHNMPFNNTYSAQTRQDEVLDFKTAYNIHQYILLNLISKHLTIELPTIIIAVFLNNHVLNGSHSNA